MKVSKEVKIGTLVSLGIMLFIFGYSFLKGEKLFESTNVYYAEFDYNALTKASPVTVKGNLVGKITDIAYNYKTGKTKVSFFVNEQLTFSKESLVRMYETSMMGGNGLAIIVSTEGVLAAPGDLLKSDVELGLVTSLSKNFSGISNNLDQTLKSTEALVVSLNRVVNDTSQKGLNHTIQQLNQTLKSFETTSNKINDLLVQNNDNVTDILQSFKKVSEDWAMLSSDIKKADLGTTITSLNQTLASVNKVLAKVDNGEGALGQLINNKDLYQTIESATKEMEMLLKDIKLHPKRYFRILSKKEIPYQAEPSN